LLYYVHSVALNDPPEKKKDKKLREKRIQNTTIELENNAIMPLGLDNNSIL
jgi:hypothetical protein